MIPNDKLRVLLVEDNPGDADLVRVFLGQDQSRIDLSHVGSLSAAREAMHPGKVDLVLLDLGLPDGHGLGVVGVIREAAPNIPIVVLTGGGHPDWGLEALQLDAQDYLTKEELDGPSLSRAIRYAMERHRYQQQYRRQLSVSPDGMVVVGLDGHVKYVNRAARRILGGAPSSASDLPAQMLTLAGDAEDVVLDNGRTVEARSVDTVWQRHAARLINLRDITEQRRAEAELSRLTEQLKSTNERLEQLVSTDPLTSVLNRRGVEQALDGEIKRMSRTGDSLVAVLVDYDNFKDINDAYGYAVGDAALTAMTHSVRSSLRAADHIGRIGGDEFLVLLPGASLREGFAVAEKLRRTIKATTLPVADGSIALSASLAVGNVEPHTVSLEQVLATVNRSLRISKEGGKDRVSGTPGPGWEPPPAGSTLPSDFDVNAVQLAIALQPILRVDTEEVVGFEALARGPSGSYAMPADLFRAALERNVLTTLDLRALAASLRVLGKLDLPGIYHINVFPSTVLSAPTERIIRLVEEAKGIGRLCLELSEQQFLGDPGCLRGPLEALRAAGIKIAIDDVGFGRSSIEALLVLEPDVVKVDRRCVQAVDADPMRRSQLERLLAMLATIDTEVIVEGVETTGELAIVQELGIQFGQGFLFGEPESSSAA